MADGYFTTGMPVVGNNIDADLPEMAENFEMIKDAMMMLSLFLIPGYWAKYNYNNTYTDRLDSIVIKDSGGNTKATCNLYYTNGSDPYELSSEVWTITGGKVYTYPYSYLSGKLDTEELDTIT